jgi:hypothetical protein
MQVGVTTINHSPAHLDNNNMCYLKLYLSQLRLIKYPVPWRGLGFFLKFNGKEVNLGCTYIHIVYNDLARDDDTLNSIMTLKSLVVNIHNPAHRNTKVVDGFIIEIGMDFNYGGATYKLTCLSDPLNIQAKVNYPDEFSGYPIHDCFTLDACRRSILETIGE